MVRTSAFLIGLSTVVLTTLTIGNAFHQKKQFYPSVVYITKSSPSMAVIYIQALAIAYMIFSFMRKIFFGALRATEIEHLSERTWHAVMETCLAFTVFRDDFSPRFVMQFVLLLFVKSFHWLCEDRVDYMERSPIITVVFHCRMMSLLAFLSGLDSYFVSHAYFITLVKGASVQIVFGFEYAILLTMVLHVGVKYVLHLNDLRTVQPWENKAVYLLYTELLINLLRCILYTVFVAVMIRLHTFPLFSIRPLYLTIRAFHKAINDVILSRRAVYAMNHLFPLASEEDLLQGDSTCIICREEMLPGSGAKKLPCNHIFHSNCLRSWFQRQQSCPTCRTDILAQRRQPPAPVRPAPAPPAPADDAAGAAAVGNDISGEAAAPESDGPPNVPEAPPNTFAYAGRPGTSQGIQNIYVHNLAEGLDDSMQSSVPNLFNLPNGIPFMPSPTFMPLPPPIPYMFPPPPNDPSLSDAEVAAMEGRERAAIEARIACLRNIGLLLDAACIQLQQYMSVVQSISIYPSQTTVASTQTSTSLTDIHEPSNTTSSERLLEASRSLTNANTAVQSLECSSEINSSATQSTSALEVEDTSLPESSGKSDSLLSHVRQRRLEKFSSERKEVENSDDRNVAEE